MANPLPMTLRFYRGLSSAMVPLAPALIKRRLKLGKEDPDADRRAARHHPRCQAARAADLDSWRQRRRGACFRRADRAAARAQHPHPPDVGHRDVGRDRRQTLSARHHPSICALRLPALCRALPRSLAAVARLVHRVRPVAEPDPAKRGAPAADGADQRADVAALVPALAAGAWHDLGAAGKIRHLPRAISDRRGALCRARLPQRHRHGQSQARRSGASRRSQQARTADVADPRPADHRCGLDPSGRRGNPDRDAQDARRILPAAPDRDRAAASRPRALRSGGWSRRRG